MFERFWHLMNFRHPVVRDLEGVHDGAIVIPGMDRHDVRREFSSEEAVTGPVLFVSVEFTRLGKSELMVSASDAA